MIPTTLQGCCFVWPWSATGSDRLLDGWDRDHVPAALPGLGGRRACGGPCGRGGGLLPGARAVRGAGRSSALGVRHARRKNAAHLGEHLQEARKQIGSGMASVEVRMEREAPPAGVALLGWAGGLLDDLAVGDTLHVRVIQDRVTVPNTRQRLWRSLPRWTERLDRLCQERLQLFAAFDVRPSLDSCPLRQRRLPKCDSSAVCHWDSA